MECETFIAKTKISLLEGLYASLAVVQLLHHFEGLQAKDMLIVTRKIAEIMLLKAN